MRLDSNKVYYFYQGILRIPSYTLNLSSATGPVANVMYIYKLSQLIKSIKVSGGGLVVTL